MLKDIKKYKKKPLLYSLKKQRYASIINLGCIKYYDTEETTGQRINYKYYVHNGRKGDIIDINYNNPTFKVVPGELLYINSYGEENFHTENFLIVANVHAHIKRALASYKKGYNRKMATTLSTYKNNKEDF